MKDVIFSTVFLCLISIGYMTLWAERRVYGRPLSRREWEREFDSEIGQKAITVIQHITLLASIVLGIYLFAKDWLLVVVPLLLLFNPFTRGLINIVITCFVLTPIFGLLNKFEKHSRN